MIHGLLMAAAIDAAAPNDADVNERAPDAFGRAGSVVLGEVIAARAMTAPHAGVGGLGGAGTLSAGWFAFSSTRRGEDTTKSISLEPSFDVFVGHGVSLGAVLGGGVTSFGSDRAGSSMEHWHLTAMPRIGEAVELTSGIAMWPRFAAGVTLSDSPGQERIGTAFRATFDVPFVFRLTRHVALQAGPHLTYMNQLAGPPDVRGFGGGASAGLSIVL